MKRNLIVSAAIIFLILPCTIFFSDGLSYLITSLMAFAIMVIIFSNRSSVIKITRWAKANPKKTQLIIAGLQIVLMALGIFAGNNLKELGYEFSSATPIVFSNIIIVGFLSVRFLLKRSTIAIPKAVNRQRFAFMCIALSSFVMMVITGNRLGERYPNSPLIHAVKAIDQAIFQDATQFANFSIEASDPGYKKNHEQVLINGFSPIMAFASFIAISKKRESVASSTDPKKVAEKKLKAEKKAKKFEKRMKKLISRFEKHKRLGLVGVMAGMSVGIILLLVLMSCTSVCLIAGGIIALIDGEALGILAILIGALLGWVSIKTIKDNSNKPKPPKEGNP